MKLGFFIGFLICFVIHILVIIMCLKTVKISKNKKLKTVLTYILIFIVPVILWEPILGIKRKN